MKLIFNILKKISHFAMISFIFYSVFILGAFYGEYKTIGQTPQDFFIDDISYKWEVSQGAPAILTDQINAYNNVIKNIWYSLFFMVMVFFFDYFIDKPNHFVTKIKERFKNG